MLAVTNTESIMMMANLTRFQSPMTGRLLFAATQPIDDAQRNSLRYDR